MRFTVQLSPAAEQDLAAAWLASDDRPAVTFAAHQMERKLATNPLDAGESRGSSVIRIDYISPLGFTFDVIMDDSTVFVTAIWLVS
jgi:hypothetical protein